MAIVPRKKNRSQLVHYNMNNPSLIIHAQKFFLNEKNDLCGIGSGQGASSESGSEECSVIKLSISSFPLLFY